MTFLQRAFDSFAYAVSGVHQVKPVQHHGRTEDGSHRIGNTLAGDIRCRAMDRILLFMIMKAGLIVAVFMHMMWERMALMFAILIPPVLVLIFVFLMTREADYTFFTRGVFFATGS